jgi:hypothetical protein
MLEENSQLYELKDEANHAVVMKRRFVGSRAQGLDIWFMFLEDEKGDKDEFHTSLGYFSEVFIPFVKFYFS